MHAQLVNQSSAPGTARLLIVVPVALVSFFYMNMLEYALPLYFEARSEAARLAGRRAPGIAAVIMLSCFSLAVLAMGTSLTLGQFFWSVAAFEFVRQFMRWSHSGYMSEHMHPDLRATTIGLTITISGLGSTLFVWIAPSIWDPAAPDFQTAGPFQAAAVCGLIGSVGLTLYDRICPIREVAIAEPDREGVAAPSQPAELD